MTFQLLLYNPSSYPREVCAEVPWQPIAQATGFEPCEVAVTDEQNQPVPFQIDRIDPSNPARDRLAVAPCFQIPAGPDDYSRHSAVLNITRRDDAVKAAAIAPPPGLAANAPLLLRNADMTVSLCLGPAQTGSPRRWYAGSADSVTLHEMEMLDSFRWLNRGWLGHDPEKRCMQIDRILLGNPAWEEQPEQEVKLFDREYRLLSHCAGPARQNATIVSAPFDYLASQTDKHSCRLYRTFTLYARSGHVLEELFVEGTSAKDAGGASPKSRKLRFTACYFSNMDMGYDPTVYRFDNVPDWFALGCPSGPHKPGFGFATDVHVAHIAYPDPDYPDKGNSYRTLSWQLSPCQQARCLHVFMHGTTAGFDEQIGELWYRYLYKPTRAEFRAA